MVYLLGDEVVQLVCGVDLTQLVAGPLASMHLGDLGAEVVKIELLDGGDIIRGYTPQVDGFSAQFAALNRNKHSVTLDLSTDTWLAVMDEAGVPAGPVNDTLSVWNAPYTDHQDLLQHVDPDEASDTIPITRYPTNSDDPVRDRRVDPQRLGAATERYLREVGYTESEVD